MSTGLVAQALDKVAALRAGDGPGAWRMDRAAVANRLAELVTRTGDSTNRLLLYSRPGGLREPPAAPDRDLFVLVAQEMFFPGGTWRRRVRNQVVSLVPNHWVVLRSPIQVERDEVRFAFWSWGTRPAAIIDRTMFERGYHGVLCAQ